MADTDNYTPEQQLVRVAATIDQPDKFAEVFCKAAKKQTDIHNVLKETFNELLQHDSKARNEIKGLLREIEKEDWTHFIKKVGIGGWTLIIAIVSAIAGGIARGLIGHQ